MTLNESTCQNIQSERPVCIPLSTIQESHQKSQITILQQRQHTITNNKSSHNSRTRQTDNTLRPMLMSRQSDLAINCCQTKQIYETADIQLSSFVIDVKQPRSPFCPLTVQSSYKDEESSIRRGGNTHIIRSSQLKSDHAQRILRCNSLDKETQPLRRRAVVSLHQSDQNTSDLHTIKTMQFTQNMISDMRRNIDTTPLDSYSIEPFIFQNLKTILPQRNSSVQDSHKISLQASSLPLKSPDKNYSNLAQKQTIAQTKRLQPFTLLGQLSRRLNFVESLATQVSTYHVNSKQLRTNSTASTLLQEQQNQRLSTYTDNLPPLPAFRKRILSINSSYQRSKNYFLQPSEQSAAASSHALPKEISVAGRNDPPLEGQFVIVRQAAKVKIFDSNVESKTSLLPGQLSAFVEIEEQTQQQEDATDEEMSRSN